MPQYPFFCSSCRDGFDLLLPASDNTSDPRPCPKCQAKAKRVYLAPAILRDAAREGQSNWDDEDGWMQVKQMTERGLAAKDEGEWVDSKAPARFQPDMKKVEAMRQARKAKQAPTE